MDEIRLDHIISFSNWRKEKIFEVLCLSRWALTEVNSWSYLALMKARGSRDVVTFAVVTPC